MLTYDCFTLDITQYIHRDQPEHRFSIGVGSHGNVYKGVYRWTDHVTQQAHNVDVVIKCLIGTQNQRGKIEERLNREISIWRRLQHDNVAEFLGIAYLDSDHAPGLVSRWVQHHNFLAYIGQHPYLKKKMAQDISCGVQYLHEHGVVHGDLKVNNVIISEQSRAQITDFGIARISHVKGYTTMTPRNIRYTAPELMPITIVEDVAEDNELKDIRPTKESDIFSLGILFLQLFHGPDLAHGLPYNHVPFNPRGNDFTLLKRIHEGDRPIRKRYNWIQDQHWKLMQWCWKREPSERPVIAQVLKEL